MKVCDESHEEIVFDGAYTDSCPICELLDLRADEKEEALTKLEEEKNYEIDGLEADVSQLKTSNEEYQQEIKDLNTKLEETTTT